jgi:hypothetical protein
MTITLTREEAQQVLDALADAAGCVQENYQPGHMGHGWGKEIETLRARLSAPEPVPTNNGRYLTGYGAQPEPEPVRLRRGDILRCIETNELCTVWATSTTGKTQVKWKANDFGSYTAEQIGDLFWVEPKHECVCGEPNTAGVHRQDGPCYQQPEPEPVAWMNESDIGKTDWKVWAHGKPTATIPLYAAPPQRKWQGLTGDDIHQISEKCGLMDAAWQDVMNAVEAKLKEKNNG